VTTGARRAHFGSHAHPGGSQPDRPGTRPGLAETLRPSNRAPAQTAAASRRGAPVDRGGVKPNVIQAAYGPESLDTTSIYLGVPFNDVPQSFDKYEKMRTLPPKVELVEFGRSVDKTCTRDAFQVLIEADKRKQRDAKIKLIK
jgi:hypothetical protein